MAHGRTETGLYYDAERREMQARDREMIPTRLVIAMFSMALISLVLVSLAVITNRPLVGVAAPEPAVARHEVILSGEGNASHVVTSEGVVLMDAENGAFVTVVRQGLERARLVHGLAGNPPVIITEWESGRWSLDDPATGWSMALSSFGAGNTRHFVRLFK